MTSASGERPGPRRALVVRRRLSSVLLGAWVLTGIFAGGSPLGAQQGGASPSPTAGDATSTTLEEMATCLRSRERLLLVLLVDESGSLRTTDPQNERVTAARVALRSFASLASTRVAGHLPRIDVLVAGFSSSFTAIAPWGALDEERLAGVEASVEGFASLNSGLDTDFPTAFIGARRELAARSAALSEGGAAEPCKAVLLFTDGRYDIEAGDTPARREAGTEKQYAPGVSLLDPANGPVVEAAGRDLLCRTDGSGLTDRLRDDGAIIVTVALAAQIDAADQDFLRALSTGHSGDVTCGANADAKTGAYLAATDLSELAPAFSRVATSIAGATEAPGSPVVETCQGSECERGRRSFDLDPILRKFSVLADTRTPGVTIEVRAPHTADPLVIVSGADGEQAIAGAELRWSWVTETTVELNADLPGGRDSWVGHWSVTFVDPDARSSTERPRADVFLYGSWTPELAGDAHLLRGEEAELVIVVVDADGGAVPAEALARSEARVEATLADPTAGTEETVPLSGPDAQGRFHATYSAGADLQASTLELDIRLAARTEPGVELAPSTARYRLAVDVPDLYPHVRTSELRLTSVRGTGEARGTIELVGGRDRAGCVWFESPEFDSFPSEAISFSSEISPKATKSDCMQIVAGESRLIDVGIRPRASSEGSVRGTLTINVSARGERDSLPVTVPFSFDAAPPINEARRLGLFVAILLAGVLAPLAALMLVNRLLARFEPACRVVAARVPVSAERTVYRVLREYSKRGDSASAGPTDDAGILGGLALDPSVFTPIGRGARRSREITYGDLRLRARASHNPFREPFGTVACDRPCAAGGPNRTSADTPSHVPLALPGSWVFILRDGEGDAAAGDARDGAPVDDTGASSEAADLVRGDLVVFLAAGSPIEAQLPPVMASLHNRLSVTANDLATNQGTNQERRR